jgi:hypothetical protein
MTSQTLTEETKDSAALPAIRGMNYYHTLIGRAGAEAERERGQIFAVSATRGTLNHRWIYQGIVGGWWAVIESESEGGQKSHSHYATPPYLVGGRYEEN